MLGARGKFWGPPDAAVSLCLALQARSAQLEVAAHLRLVLGPQGQGEDRCSGHAQTSFSERGSVKGTWHLLVTSKSHSRDCCFLPWKSQILCSARTWFLEIIVLPLVKMLLSLQMRRPGPMGKRTRNWWGGGLSLGGGSRSVTTSLLPLNQLE